LKAREKGGGQYDPTFKCEPWRKRLIDSSKLLLVPFHNVAVDELTIQQYVYMAMGLGKRTPGKKCSQGAQAFIGASRGCCMFKTNAGKEIKVSFPLAHSWQWDVSKGHKPKLVERLSWTSNQVLRVLPDML